MLFTFINKTLRDFPANISETQCFGPPFVPREMIVSAREWINTKEPAGKETKFTDARLIPGCAAALVLLPLPPPPSPYLRGLFHPRFLKTFRISVVIERIASRSPIGRDVFPTGDVLSFNVFTLAPDPGSTAFWLRSSNTRLNARGVYPPLWLLCIPRNRNGCKYVIY